MDALDKYSTELQQLLDLIAREDSKSTSKVKWLITSRHKPEIKERLRPDALQLRVSLELNSDHVLHAINTFINSKVQKLAKNKRYNPILRQEIESMLREKAEDTFL